MAIGSGGITNSNLYMCPYCIKCKSTLKLKSLHLQTATIQHQPIQPRKEEINIRTFFEADPISSGRSAVEDMANNGCEMNGE